MTTQYAADEAHRWVAAFSEALDARDAASAAALFGDECFWRDLAAFTWNVKTLEGRDEIAAMLAAQLDSVGPTAWRVEGEPTVAGEVLEAWVKFETKLARGRSILRLKDGRAWTLLTAIEELKGFEERKGPSRPVGVEHGVYRREKTWLEAKRAEDGALGKGRQPYCVVIGGGQGGIMLGARLKQLNVPTIILEKNSHPGNSLAEPIPFPRAARSGLVRPSAVHPLPRELADIHAEGQARRLARDVHQGDGAKLLELLGGRPRRLRR